MYFLTALACTVIAVLLWVLLKNKRHFHLEYLAITFGGATIMWLIDCIACSIEGEPFLSFEMPIDLYISLWTIAGGLIFYGVLLLVITLVNKKKVGK